MASSTRFCSVGGHERDHPEWPVSGLREAPHVGWRHCKLGSIHYSENRSNLAATQMKTDVLQVLQCPRCGTQLRLESIEEQTEEIRHGTLSCTRNPRHRYAIEDGIIRFGTGFDHEAVQRELAYEDSTYSGQDMLTDPQVIANFPDSLERLWPHTRNFGPDFRRLIEELPRAHAQGWVLDVGTAACWSPRLLAERGWQVIALDVTAADYYGLKAADIQFQAHNVYFERVLESMTDLPMRDECLDAITFNASFHHTPDLKRTLQECFRVLKPKGVVAMVNEEFGSVRHRYLSRPKELTDTGSHHNISFTEFEATVEATGFSSRYLVARHVQDRLRGMLSPVVGDCAVQTLECFPALIKQLNSALVILTKAGHATVPSELREYAQILAPAMGSRAELEPANALPSGAVPA